jgi:hypothetical protein
MDQLPFTGSKSRTLMVSHVAPIQLCKHEVSRRDFSPPDGAGQTSNGFDSDKFGKWVKKSL